MIRQELPDVGVLMLSQYVEERYVTTLMEHGAEGVGYLLKDRVAEVERFTDAIRQVGAKGTVLDPEVVSHMLGRRTKDQPIDGLNAIDVRFEAFVTLADPPSSTTPARP